MSTHRFVRRRRIVQWLALAPLLSTPAGACADDAPVPERLLSFGVLPFMSPVALLKRFFRLRDHLAARLGRTVVLETARDYPEFVRRTAERRYDIVLTAPHFTVLAVDSGNYTVRATYREPLAAVVLVRDDSRVDDIGDLAGQMVATPPPEAIVTLVGRQHLEAALAGGRHPVYRSFPSHNAAYHALAGGEARAALVTVNVLAKALGGGLGLSELTRSPDFPAMGILTASDLPRAIQERAAGAFIDLDRDEDGRTLLRGIGYRGYRAAVAAEFEPLRPYALLGAAAVRGH